VLHPHNPHGQASHPIRVGVTPDLATLCRRLLLIQPPPSRIHLYYFSHHLALSLSHIRTFSLFFLLYTDNYLSRTSLIYDLCVCLLNREHPAETVYVTGTFDNWSGNTHKLDKEGSVHSKTVELEPTTDKILYKVRRNVISYCLHCPPVSVSAGRQQRSNLPQSNEMCIRTATSFTAHSSPATNPSSSSSSPTVSGNTIPPTTQKPTEPAT
jgi:hypothetical protein